MTQIRANSVLPSRASNVTAVVVSLLLMVGLSACGKDGIRENCDEARPYQSVVAGQRVVVPDGLDSLDERREMPIPKANTPARHEGAGCIEKPPSILSGSSGA